MKKLFFRPVKPFTINQRFGEHSVCIETDGDKIIWCDGKNPPDGYKSLYGPKGHLGLDLRATHSQPVYCALDGTVYKVDTLAKSGLDVRVESVVGERRFRHIYEHLLGYQPGVRTEVKSGDLIGWADNTGYSSRDHLHFQIEEYVGGKWTPIDPMAVMSDIHAQDIRSITEILARLADLIADLLRRKR